MRTAFHWSVGLLSSLGLSCVLLTLLGLLTWLGTLEQVDNGLFEVQKKYFESFFLVHETAWFPVPLPGANLVMCVLFVNLVLGGLVKLRKGWRMAGVMVTHVGIALLLLSGFVKMYFSDDGFIKLYEGQSKSVFQSYHRWELAIARDAGDGRIEEFVVPQEDFLDAKGARTVTLASPELPFELEVGRAMRNCRPLPKGPMVDAANPVIDGVFLDERPLAKQAEVNDAGAYATAVLADGTRIEGLLWGGQAAPWTVAVDGVEWGVDLRKERYPMPFTIRLDEFTKEDHPRMSMARVFSSDVTVFEGGSSRPILISMNEPLRDEGLVLYQSSYGPQDPRSTEPAYSVLSVVRNPADTYPLIACVVIAAGLVIHFTRKLTKYVRSEAQRA